MRLPVNAQTRTQATKTKSNTSIGHSERHKDTIEGMRMPSLFSTPLSGAHYNKKRDPRMKFFVI
jgi:hypothetical protein